MTREEAKAIIRKEYLCVDRDCDIERSCGKCDLMMPSKELILEAYKMAMDALEQLQTCGTCGNEDTYHCADCENKSDYEQAQADGEYILKKDVMCCIGQTSVHSELARKLRGLPSVAIPNKVGHWEYNQYDGNPNIGNWHCSECRNIVSDMPTCMGKPLYEFCPHCGSPMEIER